ncbi:MAG: thioesterase family protein [Pseudomonadota bacterium]
MNLYLRLLWALCSGVQRGSIPHDATALSSFRVLPHDLDLFGHMNNGRYLQIMDVARAEWMLRSGVFRCMREHQWTAVLGGNMTRFRRSLRLWQRYAVSSRLVCWDERWFYFEHRFVDHRGQALAIGVSRAGLRNARAWVPASDVAARVAPGAESAEMPGYLKRWVCNEAAMADEGAGVRSCLGLSSEVAQS